MTSTVLSNIFSLTAHLKKLTKFCGTLLPKMVKQSNEFKHKMDFIAIKLSLIELESSARACSQ